ncbi:MAG TPA: hypothetical protein DIT25_03180 [Candidatus Moranbacteria bacterium]|nr:hypothetical protein [Candidatus Moranbacteria bacterium]
MKGELMAQRRADASRGSEDLEANTGKLVLPDHVAHLPISLSQYDKRMVLCKRPEVKKIYSGRETFVAVLWENDIPSAESEICTDCRICF